MIVKYELARMWKKVILVYLKVLYYRNFVGGTEENFRRSERCAKHPAGCRRLDAITDIKLK
jgi:hypothetical protein